MNKLHSMNGWADHDAYSTRRSAQSYLNPTERRYASSGCGSGCGSTEEKPKPSACGAGDDDPKPQPSACGADDDNKGKPSACGSSCGTGDK